MTIYEEISKSGRIFRRKECLPGYSMRYFKEICDGQRVNRQVAKASVIDILENGEEIIVVSSTEFTRRNKSGTRKRKTESIYERFSTHSIDEVERLFKKETYKGKKSKERTGIAGKNIITFDPRYRAFFEKGYKCVTCGIEGEYFALERCGGRGWHLNLYAIDESGKDVLMTRDHIVPRSISHDNSIDNMQTMCTFCNQDKADKII